MSKYDDRIKKALAEPGIIFTRRIEDLLHEMNQFIDDKGWDRGIDADELALEPGSIQMIAGERPPLGLRPTWVVATKRIEEIQEAMTRYIDADVNIPRDWFDELALASGYLDRSRENRKI